MSGEIITLEGDLVTIEQRAIVRQIPLKEFTRLLVQKVPVTLPVLPRTAVFAHWDESDPMQKKLYILAEIPPGIRTITKVARSDSMAGARKYKLSFPWTYLWFAATQEGTRNWAITQYSCFHSRDQFSGPDHPLWVAFCHNVYSRNGHICFGSAGAPPNQSIANQIDWLVNNWYVTNFNADLEREMIYPFGGTSYKKWVDATAEKGATAYLDFPEWGNNRRRKFTVRELIEDGPLREGNIQAEWAIPEIPAPFTFGRAEEWLRTLTTEDRSRLKVALNNFVADNPGLVTDDIPQNEVVEDDGGTPFN